MFWLLWIMLQWNYRIFFLSTNMYCICTQKIYRVDLCHDAYYEEYLKWMTFLGISFLVFRGMNTDQTSGQKDWRKAGTMFVCFNSIPVDFSCKSSHGNEMNCWVSILWCLILQHVKVLECLGLGSYIESFRISEYFNITDLM